MERRSNLIKQLDWTTILLYLVMVVCGWFTIYAACYDFEHPSLLDFSMRHGMQLVWIFCALALAVVILLIDSKFYNNIAYIFYGAMILLLIVTIFISPDIKGSHSWIKIGSFSIQPAEFAKYATALCLARFMSRFEFDMQKTRDILSIAAMILLPMAIIVAQSETGSALVFVSFLLMLYREGLNGLVLVLGFVAVVFFVVVLRFNNLPVEAGMNPPIEDYGYLLVFIGVALFAAFMLLRYTRDRICIRTLVLTNVGIYAVAALVRVFKPEWLRFTDAGFVCMGVSTLLLFVWSLVKRRKSYALIGLLFVATVGLAFSVDYAFDKVLEPHQQIRIKIVLGLEDDPQGAGYNVRQSQIAIGSGGFLGKGFLNGTQTKLNYVPEQDTDFIFCTIGEERGFIGTFFVIALYVTLIIRLVIMAERQRSSFSRIYGYSVASIFFFHFVINIGMVIGIVPVIGIPLPFFSYGGSSMWGFTLLLFTFLRLDANRMEILQQQ
ncbi:MAG: rod shape-determining protein RodA [Paludibacteraceae bacterium]|nr:rod shape-determining protein RodA [Paludibacteraceae bacterium]